MWTNCQKCGKRLNSEIDLVCCSRCGEKLPEGVACRQARTAVSPVNISLQPRKDLQYRRSLTAFAVAALVVLGIGTAYEIGRTTLGSAETSPSSSMVSKEADPPTSVLTDSHNFELTSEVRSARHPLTTAEIVARCEKSVALVTGDHATGSAFLIASGLAVTNSHVLEGEFMESIKVYFPSAPHSSRGPYPARLLYDDKPRDLAFLKVPTDLPPLKIANSWHFRKGSEVTVIGNPRGLQNAVSRGVVSTLTELNGQSFHQLGIPVNPGNSGGPALNSFGEVIGVVTAKSLDSEGITLSIPTGALAAAAASVQSQSEIDQQLCESGHRVEALLLRLAAIGDVYRDVYSTDAYWSPNGPLIDEAQIDIERFHKLFVAQNSSRIELVIHDNHLTSDVRDYVKNLVENSYNLQAGVVGSERTRIGTLLSRHGSDMEALLQELGIKYPLQFEVSMETSLIRSSWKVSLSPASHAD